MVYTLKYLSGAGFVQSDSHSKKNKQKNTLDLKLFFIKPTEISLSGAGPGSNYLKYLDRSN